MEATFQPGETVRLRTGGQIMVVVRVLDGGARYLCGWFDDQRGGAEEAFAADQLQHAVDPDS